MEKTDKPLILLVEDEPEIKELTQEMLESKFQIISASNGKEALCLLKKTIPDLVITDINMPQMNGLLLLKRMRQDPRLVHVPVIINSSNGDIYIHKLSCATQTWIMAEKSCPFRRVS